MTVTMPYPITPAQQRSFASADSCHMRAEPALVPLTFASTMLTNEVEIWQRIRSGDQNALRLVFDAHYAPLCRFAMQWTADRDEAEDIVQRLFVDLWEKRDAIAVQITLRSYLFAAVRNRGLNFVKHKKVVAMHQKNMQGNAQADASVSDLDEVQLALEKAMAQLPEQCRKVFRLVKIEGKRYVEVAEELQISTKTIENHMTKALRLLREAMKEFLPMAFWLIYLLAQQ